MIGGTGSFGRRLVSGLIATTDHQAIIAARDLSRAQALADEMNAGKSVSRATAMCIDVRTTTAEELKSSGAFLVVDAAGPFQKGDYRLARAAIAAKMHYIDLADARDFVAGFTQLDNEAKAAGITALTGASSTPALSNAVIDRLTQRVAGSRVDRDRHLAGKPGAARPCRRSVHSVLCGQAGESVPRWRLDGAPRLGDDDPSSISDIWGGGGSRCAKRLISTLSWRASLRAARRSSARALSSLSCISAWRQPALRCVSAC